MSSILMNKIFQQEHALLNRIESVLSDDEKKKLTEITSAQKYNATLLPIRTVGVQVYLSSLFVSS